MLALIHRLHGFKLYIYAFGVISLLSVSFVMATPSQANAWMQEYCDFKLSLDDKKIDVTCNDDHDNGTLDGHTYTKDGSSSKYKLTQYGAIDCEDGNVGSDADCKVKYVNSDDSYAADCESTLTLESKTKASVSGSYARLVEHATWQVECQELNPGTRSGKITINSLDNQINIAKSTAWKKLEKEVEKHVSLVGCSSSYQVVSTTLVGSFLQEDDGTSKPMSQACKDLAICFDKGFTAERLEDVEKNADAIRTAIRNCIRALPPPNLIIVDPPPSLTSLTNAQINAAVNAAIGVTNSVVVPKDEDLEGEDPEESETSCAIDGVGWIVCPLMNFLADLNDKAFGVLTNFLEIEDELTTNTSLRAAWSTFRDMANVAFVIAFLIIIYSQLTGAGVTNYGIKRLMPKMIIAAVLVNSSLILCQIAVDLSNIVGSTIYNLLTNLANADSSDTNAAGGWTEVVGLLLAGAVGVGLLIAIILAPTALLAIGAAVLILIARKAIIILLIVVAPLAFVAYLLPNTEDWFKKWWKMFSTLLMLFPVIGLIFGASSLAAGIINNVAGDADGQHLLQLTALGIMAVPLFAVPVVLKGALSAAGSVGQRLSGWQDRANRRGMRGIKESRLGEAKGAFDARRQSRKLNRRVGDGRFLGVIPSGRINKAIDKTKFGRYIGGDRGAAAATAGVLNEYNEEANRQKTTMSKLDHVELMKIVKDEKSSEERRAAAAGVISSRSFRKGHQELLDYLGDEDVVSKGGDTIKTIQQQAAYDMKSFPAGMGDRDKGALGEGRFKKSIPKDPTTGKPIRTVSEQAMLERLHEGKLSEETFAGLDPDDLTIVAGLKSGGHLTPEAQTTIDNLIDRLRKPENANIYAASKDNARAIHNTLHT
jgi:hypothetical protein